MLTPTRLRSSLRALGVPNAYLPADVRRGLLPALARALAELPEAEPVELEAGDVIAVLGSAARSARLAGQLALNIGLDPAAVASGRPGSAGEIAASSASPDITSITSARHRALDWAQRLEPTVVWLDAPVGSGRGTWAGRIVEALQPRTVWGVVEASRKPEDVRAWACAVGGIDALAVEDLDATTSPAAVLGIGVPVVLADGKRATPEAWAALLADRLRQQAA